MTHHLSLIAKPGSCVLVADAIARVERELTVADLGFAGGSGRWLAPGEAWECAIDAGDLVAGRARVIAMLAPLLDGLPVDVNIIHDAGAVRRKKLLVADMDSTIIEQECIDEMADMLGLKPRIAAITERAMNGEIAFEAALAERVGLLRGLPESDLARVFTERVTIMPGARTLLATMAAHGAYTALVSGGFSYFTSRVRAAVGFDLDRSNTLDLADGRLTGKVLGAIVGKEAKLESLVTLRDARGLSPDLTLAVGDGANDLAMIKAAGLGVAYRAKPIVTAEATAGVTHGDLTALLYLQGYARAEFVTA